MPSNYLIDQILPTRELHLTGGCSGVGKTTWLLQMLHHLTLGRPIFNYPSRPTEWVYVSCDRSGEGMERTLDRLALPHDRNRFHSLEDIPVHRKGLGLADAESILIWSPAPLVVIEAFTLLMPTGRQDASMNNYQSTGNWLRHLSRLTKRYDKTIIASVHSPKTKEGNGYNDKRQRVLGSVAFGALVETIFLVERTGEEDENKRVLHLLPRNAPEQAFYFDLDKSGRFVEAMNPSDEAITVIIEDQFRLLGPGEAFETGELLEKVRGRGVSDRSFYRWLQVAGESKRVEKVSRGVWRKVVAS